MTRQNLTKVKRFLWFLPIIYLFPYSCDIIDHTKEPAVITVGEMGIIEDDLKRDLKLLALEMGITDQEIGLMIRPLVNRVVDNYLILEYGRSKGITISEKELESALEDISKDYTQKAFQEMLLKRYIEFDEWRDSVRQELLIKKIILEAMSEITPVTFYEIKGYFESHRDEFIRPQMVKLRQIVTSSSSEAEKILGFLADGQDMGELAKKYSITPEAKQRGELGWVSKGEMEESMEKLFFPLPIGKASSVLESPYGYHIFEVLAKQSEGYYNLPESMAMIESKLSLQKKDLFYKRWIAQLKEIFPVKIDQKIYKDWSMDR